MQAKTKRTETKRRKVLMGVGFWLLSLTWGLPLTLFGTIVALGFLITGHKPKRFYCFIYFETGSGWGGFEGGPIFFVEKSASLSMKCHEAGHGLQNIMFGVFMPFIVSIPSCIRYWYHKYKTCKGLGNTLPAYDSIWFEGQATRLGDKYFGERVSE